jgi:hypothetical protein
MFQVYRDFGLKLELFFVNLIANLIHCRNICNMEPLCVYFLIKNCSVDEPLTLYNIDYAD